MKNIYVTKEVIDDISFSEIDIDLKEEYGFDYEDESEYIEIKVGNPNVDTEPIKIDILIKALKRLKEDGSTHVSLDYHCDHIGYDITGYKIYLSTEEQIKAYEDKLAINQEKALKLRALQEEYKRIENE
jgi:hypothetical protein